MVHNYQVSPYVGQRGESRTRSFLLPKQAAYHQAITLIFKQLSVPATGIEPIKQESKSCGLPISLHRSSSRDTTRTCNQRSQNPLR